LRWLKAANPHGDYTDTYLGEYAHLDGMIGRDAAKDVYPAILAFLDRTQCPRRAVPPTPAPTPTPPTISSPTPGPGAPRP
jgi:hypothetical protein